MIFLRPDLRLSCPPAGAISIQRRICPWLMPMIAGTCRWNLLRASGRNITYRTFVARSAAASDNSLYSLASTHPRRSLCGYFVCNSSGDIE